MPQLTHKLIREAMNSIVSDETTRYTSTPALHQRFRPIKKRQNLRGDVFWL